MIGCFWRFLSNREPSREYSFSLLEPGRFAPLTLPIGGRFEVSRRADSLDGNVDPMLVVRSSSKGPYDLTELCTYFYEQSKREISDRSQFMAKEEGGLQTSISTLKKEIEALKREAPNEDYAGKIQSLADLDENISAKIEEMQMLDQQQQELEANITQTRGEIDSLQSEIDKVSRGTENLLGECEAKQKKLEEDGAENTRYSQLKNELSAGIEDLRTRIQTLQEEVSKNRWPTFTSFSSRVSQEGWNSQAFVELTGLYREAFLEKVTVQGFGWVRKFSAAKNAHQGGGLDFHKAASMHACLQLLGKEIPSFVDKAQNFQIASDGIVFSSQRDLEGFFQSYLGGNCGLSLQASQLEKLVTQIYSEKKREKISEKGFVESYPGIAPPITLQRTGLLQWSFLPRKKEVSPAELWSCATLFGLIKSPLWSEGEAFSSKELADFRQEGWTFSGRENFQKVTELFVIGEFKELLKEFLASISLQNIDCSVTFGRKDIASIFKEHTKLWRIGQSLKEEQGEGVSERTKQALQSFMEAIEQKRARKIQTLQGKILGAKNEQVKGKLEKDLAAQQRKKEQEAARFSPLQKGLQNPNKAALISHIEAVLGEMVDEESVRGIKKEFLKQIFYQEVVKSPECFELPMFNAISFKATLDKNSKAQLDKLKQNLDGVFAQLGVVGADGKVKTCMLDDKRLLVNLSPKDLSILTDRFASLKYAKNMGAFRGLIRGQENQNQGFSANVIAGMSPEQLYFSVLTGQLLEFIQEGTWKADGRDLTSDEVVTVRERELTWLSTFLERSIQLQSSFTSGSQLPILIPAEMIIAFVQNFTLPTFKVFETQSTCTPLEILAECFGFQLLQEDTLIKDPKKLFGNVLNLSSKDCHLRLGTLRSKQDIHYYTGAPRDIILTQRGGDRVYVAASPLSVLSSAQLDKDDKLFVASVIYRAIFLDSKESGFFSLSSEEYTFLFALFAGLFQETGFFQKFDPDQKRLWKENVLQSVLPAPLITIKKQENLRLSPDALQNDEFSGNKFVQEGLKNLFSVLVSLKRGEGSASAILAIGALLSIQHGPGDCNKGFAGKIAEGVVALLCLSHIKEPCFPNLEERQGKTVTATNLRAAFIEKVIDQTFQDIRRIEGWANETLHSCFRGPLSSDYYAAMGKYLGIAASKGEPLPSQLDRSFEPDLNLYNKNGFAAAKKVIQKIRQGLPGVQLWQRGRNGRGAYVSYPKIEGFLEAEEVSLRVFAAAYLGFYEELNQIKQGTSERNNPRSFLRDLGATPEQIEQLGEDFFAISTELPLLVLKFLIKEGFLSMAKNPNYFNEGGFKLVLPHMEQDDSLSLVPEEVSKKLQDISEVYSLGDLLAKYLRKEFIREERIREELEEKKK